MVENNNSVLYTAIADRTTLPSAKSVLLSIAGDHSQHSSVLKDACDGAVNPRVRQASEKEFAGVFGIAYDIYKETIKKEEISTEELEALTDRLSILENALADKYIDVQTKSASASEKTNNKSEKADLTNLSQVFANMIGDSVHHRELLATVKSLAKLKQKETLSVVAVSCMPLASISNPVCQSP
jgi:hypothetical protein